MADEWIDFADALALALAAVAPLAAESVPLSWLTGRVAATDVTALVDAPSTDISLKDGYAVLAAATSAASSSRPQPLRLLGRAAAGRPFAGELQPGSAVRVLSGAAIPSGADAVLAEEYARVQGDTVLALDAAAAGRNILPRATDVAAGSQIVAAGAVLGPAQVGLLAAAGYAGLDVVRRPRVAIVATGDELVVPGGELRSGQVYASNAATIAAWCAHFGLESEVTLAGDEGQALEQRLRAAHEYCDAVVTTGGTWGSERDSVGAALERLGWRRLYHRVRLAPGKGAASGLWDGRPVFCLPGGPPAGQMAFLQLALPALLKLAGRRDTRLPWLAAALGAAISGEAGWTQFVEGRLAATPAGMVFRPARLASRLQSMAGAEGLVMIPAGTAAIPAGTVVPVQLLPGALCTEGSQALPPANLGPATGQPAAPPPVVSIVARSGTGKTTFLEQLLPALAAAGLRVGVLKHHAHAIPFDVPGKDTYRLAQAGAGIVAAACPVQVAVFRQEDGSANLEAVIARDLAGTDLVLTEGFKRGSYPKIEVHRRAHSAELLCAPGELLALVTDEPLDLDVPQFGLADFAGVAAFLSAWVQRPRSASGSDLLY